MFRSCSGLNIIRLERLLSIVRDSRKKMLVRRHLRKAFQCVSPILHHSESTELSELDLGEKNLTKLVINARCKPDDTHGTVLLLRATVAER